MKRILAAIVLAFVLCGVIAAADVRRSPAHPRNQAPRASRRASQATIARMPRRHGSRMAVLPAIPMENDDQPVEVAGSDSVAPTVNRAADGVLAELQSAVDAKEYEDAARILVTSNLSHEGGVVPSPSDDRLFVSVDVALHILMRNHDGFRDAMCRRIGATDQFKIDQTMSRGDPDAIAALPLQYYGTPASAPPCRWLGDRALAAGDLGKALHWYKEALRVAAPDQRSDLAARKRLVSAMLGVTDGDPPVKPISFGGAMATPAQFEGWVRDQLALHAASENSPRLGSIPMLAAVAPAKIESTPFGQWEESTGRGFGREDMPNQSYYDVDWSWHHLGMYADDEFVYMYNRSRIAAFDLAGGKMRWIRGLDNDWSPGPARPIFTAERIYVSALAASEQTGVMCLDRKTGRQIWLSNCGGKSVSDPLWNRGRLYTLVITPATRRADAPLCLVELRPDSGEMLARRLILDLTEQHSVRPGECQAACMGHRVVMLIAGSILCTDFQGKILWVRDDALNPPEVSTKARRKGQRQLLRRSESEIARQFLQPPILANGQLIVHQPGTNMIECLDLETGECRWRRQVAGLQRIAQLGDGRLLANTQSGLDVLDSASGNVLWRRDLDGLLSAEARTASGLILVVRQTPPGKKRQLQYLWLDAASGQTKAHDYVPLDATRPIQFGPIVAGGSRVWAAFGYGARNDSPTAKNNKRILELRFTAPAVAGEEP